MADDETDDDPELDSLMLAASQQYKEQVGKEALGAGHSRAEL